MANWQWIYFYQLIIGMLSFSTSSGIKARILSENGKQINLPIVSCKGMSIQFRNKTDATYTSHFLYWRRRDELLKLWFIWSSFVRLDHVCCMHAMECCCVGEIFCGEYSENWSDGHDWHTLDIRRWFDTDAQFQYWNESYIKNNSAATINFFWTVQQLQSWFN